MATYDYAERTAQRIHDAANNGGNGGVTWADDALATITEVLERRINEQAAQIDALNTELDALNNAAYERIAALTERIAALEAGKRRVMTSDSGGPKWDADFFAQHEADETPYMAGHDRNGY
jgi:hypothetical protein